MSVVFLKPIHDALKVQAIHCLPCGGVSPSQEEVNMTRVSSTIFGGEENLTGGEASCSYAFLVNSKSTSCQGGGGGEGLCLHSPPLM